MRADYWQTITGIASAFIALCALGLSVWQGLVARKHARLSVRPHLSHFSHGDGGSGVYTIEIVNNGIGPALIQKCTVKVDGKPVPGNNADVTESAVKTLFPTQPTRATNFGYLTPGHAFRPNDQWVFVQLEFANPPEYKFVEKTLERLDLEIAYTSFYGEPFHFRLNADRPDSWVGRGAES
jgi:hypothetical protein